MSYKITLELTRKQELAIIQKIVSKYPLAKFPTNDAGLEVLKGFRYSVYLIDIITSDESAELTSLRQDVARLTRILEQEGEPIRGHTDDYCTVDEETGAVEFEIIQNEHKATRPKVETEKNEVEIGQESPELNEDVEASWFTFQMIKTFAKQHVIACVVSVLLLAAVLAIGVNYREYRTGSVFGNTDEPKPKHYSITDSLEAIVTNLDVNQAHSNFELSYSKAKEVEKQLTRP